MTTRPPARSNLLQCELKIRHGLLARAEQHNVCVWEMSRPPRRLDLPRAKNRPSSGPGQGEGCDGIPRDLGKNATARNDEVLEVFNKLP